MRRAMADAEVGDDVYGEDPTVNALQDEFAARVGKEAALFVPSGTMGNQLALRMLTRPGESVIAGERQHVVIYENGAAGMNSGIQFHTLADAGGMLEVDDVRWVIEAATHHYPRPGLVCIENTHMPANGAVWSVERLREIAGLGLPVHLDGARLFHAEVASGVAAAEIATPATTVMCCLSKGLCAPVGSLLAGPRDVMAEARGGRQRLGGGMRQAGVIAAAGLVALRTMVERLADDHRRARRLADAIADRWPDGGLDPATVETNVVTWRHADVDAVLAHLRSEGVLGGTIAPGMLRLVTHHDVDDEAIERAIKAIASAP
jgi:threonine aldolase